VHALAVAIVRTRRRTTAGSGVVGMAFVLTAVMILVAASDAQRAAPAPTPAISANGAYVTFSEFAGLPSAVRWSPRPAHRPRRPGPLSPSKMPE